MANKFCVSCGVALEENHRFCPACGAAAVFVPQEVCQPVEVSVPSEASAAVSDPAPQPAAIPVPQVPQPVAAHVPQQAPQSGEAAPGADSKYQPISTWGYIGIFLLMSIPCVGLILMFIWAFGGCRKVNKRNLSRAALVMTLLGVIFSVIAGFAIKKTVTEAIESNPLAMFFMYPKEAETNAEAEALATLLNGLMSMEGDAEAQEGSPADESAEAEESLEAVLGDLEGLEEMLGNSDLSDLEGMLSEQDMEDLESLMSVLEGLAGDGTGEGGIDWSLIIGAPQESEESQESESSSAAE